MDWKEQLNKKMEELNIKEEENGLSNRSRTGNSNRNSSNSGRNTRDKVSFEKRQDINNDKGGKGMITVEAVLSDLEAISKGEGRFEKMTDMQKIVEIVKVSMKFLSTMRTNQLLTEEDKVRIAKEKAERRKKEEPKK